MNRIAALLVLGLALTPAAQGQKRPKTAAELAAEEAATEAEMQRQELVTLERETARALQLSNATFFKRVYSEDFVGTPSYGAVADKSMFINAIQSSETKYSSFIASDIRVRLYQETAVVTCLWSVRGSYHGHSFSRQSRVLHVYINSPRGWQAVASQETLLPGVGQ